MNHQEAESHSEAKQERRPYRVRLPGFITNEDIGLGDAIKQVTSYVGMEPCGGCKQRAAILNRWMVFSGQHPR
jgi:hypothetical protein